MADGWRNQREKAQQNRGSHPSSVHWRPAKVQRACNTAATHLANSQLSGRTQRSQRGVEGSNSFCSIHFSLLFQILRTDFEPRGSNRFCPALQALDLSIGNEMEQKGFEPSRRAWFLSVFAIGSSYFVLRRASLNHVVQIPGHRLLREYRLPGDARSYLQREPEGV